MVQAALKAFCLKPLQTAEILNFLLLVSQDQTVQFLTTKKANKKLPPATLFSLIELYLEERTESLANLIKTQVDRWITAPDLRE